MKLRWSLVALVVVLLGGGTVLLVTAPQPEALQPQAAAAALRVEVLELVPSTLEPRVIRSGVLEPRRAVELRSETHGRVIEVGAEELDRVAAGQLLVRVDPTLARIAVQAAEARVARATSDLALARLERERLRSLARSDAASRAALDRAENAVRVAEAALREAQAGLEQAREQLAKKTLRAPFAGFLRRFPVHKGEFVREGQPLAELLDLAAVRMRVGLSDREIVHVAPGAEATVRVEALESRRFRGRVLRVGEAADPLSHEFPVQIEIPNPDGTLRPGMVARAELALGPQRTALVIPREATLEEYGLRYVFVLEPVAGSERWRARRRRVRVRSLPWDPASFEVVEGLAPGERIAASGLHGLTEGALIVARQTNPS